MLNTRLRDHADAGLNLPVARVRVHLLRFGISPDLVLGAKRVTSREYVVLECELTNGSIGTAYVLTRGQPIWEAANEFARSAVGKPLRFLFAQTRERRGSTPMQRAAAVVDVCGWDLLGQLSDMPVWRLLAKTARPKKVLAVAGYRRTGESDGDVGRRLQLLATSGIGFVKVAAEADTSTTADLLSEIRVSNPPAALDLVVDMGFAATDAESASRAIESWSAHRLAWVEDPFQPSAARATATLRENSVVAVGAGDEATPDELRDLVAADAVDIVRMDATTTGGITGVCDLLATTDSRTSFHVYPEIHRHLAVVSDAVHEIEMFPPRDPFDFVDRFIHASDLVVDGAGQLPVPQAAGLGLLYAPEARDCVVASSEHSWADPDR